jgi:hypothetical protein
MARTAAGCETALGDLLDELAAIRAAPPASKVTCCPVCRLADRSVGRAIKSLFAEYVNDVRVRAALRDSRGFCPRHCELIAELGDPLGTALICLQLSDDARESWKLAPRHARPKSLLRRWRTPCPACTAYTDAETRYCGALAAGMDQQDVWNALESSAGLCVRHVESAALAAGPELGARLRAQEEARLQRLEAELEQIVRKNDYRYREEPWGAERDAWLRALWKLRR